MSDVFTPNINPLPDAPTGSPAPATAPQNSADRARLRLNAIINDKEMGAKYRAGDIATLNEVRLLNMIISEQPSADKLGAVLQGQAVPGRVENTDASNPLTTSELMSAVDGLRKQGHMDETIREIISGEPGVTEARRRDAQQIRDRLLKDHEWMRKYRSGSGEHIQQLHNLNAVLAAKIRVDETK